MTTALGLQPSVGSGPEAELAKQLIQKQNELLQLQKHKDLQNTPSKKQSEQTKTIQTKSETTTNASLKQSKSRVEVLLIGRVEVQPIE